VAHFFIGTERITKNKKIMKKILVTLMLAISPALIIPAIAQKPAVMSSDKAGWHKIGEVTASMKTEKDEIIVLGADKFKSIKIKATDAPVHIASLVVYFESGDPENINVASDLKTGGESRVIDFKGGEREIKKVSFVYKTVANAKNDKAHIELYGLK
jgi:hypothetical protein